MLCNRNTVSCWGMGYSNSLFCSQLYVNSIEAHAMHTNNFQVRSYINQFFLNRGHSGNNSVTISNYLFYIFNRI